VGKILEITQSLLNAMAKCPAQVYYSRIKDLRIPPGVAARKGSSVHKGAEHIHRVKVAKGIEPPEDEATDATRDEYMRLIKEEGVFLTPEEQENKSEVLNEGLNEALSAVKVYRRHIAPTLKEIALIEERLFADIGVGLPLSGKPDVIVDATNTDLKTSAKRWVEGTEHLTLQPTTYRLLLKANGFGPLPSRYVILSSMKSGPKDKSLIFDEGVCCEIRSTDRTDAQEEKLINRCAAVAAQLKHGDFPPGPPDQWWCTPKFCGYTGICKYYGGNP
jgi:CRISPR/Cas system-associated exonuclease Cas4 (RecB family)